MNFSFTLYDRDFVTPRRVPGKREQYRVLRFADAAIGGPDTAEIEFRGTPTELNEWLQHLRRWIVIQDAWGRARWWGIVYEVVIEDGAGEYGLSLEGWSNKIRVVYSNLNASGATASSKTGWNSDATSVATYGIRERQDNLADADAAQANERRDQLLAALKDPIRVANVAPNPNGERKARISCVGLWRTLEWQYFGKAAIQQTNLNPVGQK